MREENQGPIDGCLECLVTGASCDIKEATRLCLKMLRFSYCFGVQRGKRGNEEAERNSCAHTPALSGSTDTATPYPGAVRL